MRRPRPTGIHRCALVGCAALILAVGGALALVILLSSSQRPERPVAPIRPRNQPARPPPGPPSLACLYGVVVTAAHPSTNATAMYRFDNNLLADNNPSCAAPAVSGTQPSIPGAQLLFSRSVPGQYRLQTCPSNLGDGSNVTVNTAARNVTVFVSPPNGGFATADGGRLLTTFYLGAPNYVSDGLLSGAVFLSLDPSAGIFSVLTVAVRSANTTNTGLDTIVVFVRLINESTNAGNPVNATVRLPLTQWIRVSLLIDYNATTGHIAWDLAVFTENGTRFDATLATITPTRNAQPPIWQLATQVRRFTIDEFALTPVARSTRMSDVAQNGTCLLSPEQSPRECLYGVTVDQMHPLNHQTTVFRLDNSNFEQNTICYSPLVALAFSVPPGEFSALTPNPFRMQACRGNVSDPSLVTANRGALNGSSETTVFASEPTNFQISGVLATLYAGAPLGGLGTNLHTLLVFPLQTSRWNNFMDASNLAVLVGTTQPELPGIDSILVRLQFANATNPSVAAPEVLRFPRSPWVRISLIVHRNATARRVTWEVAVFTPNGTSVRTSVTTGYAPGLFQPVGFAYWTFGLDAPQIYYDEFAIVRIPPTTRLADVERVGTCLLVPERWPAAGAA